ncbi:hypothetical protein GCM10009809_16320 [Isoptericola hypogeus]|uniref:Excalibur calcium-binding domain-containing protein n=1 Tax=Isoptericola hypogeus TaxID=300179 RepID=A0ABN2JAN4_9MICO
MPAAPARRPALWVGLAGLAVVALIGGAAIGWWGALVLSSLYVALSAGWGVLTTRTWWGRMRRGGAAAVGGVALVALVVTSSVAGPAANPGTTADDPPAASESSTRVEVSADPAEGVEPAPVTPTARPEAEPAESDPPAPADEPEAGAQPGTALAALATLDVKGRAPKTGYDRDQFGPAWADIDHNGCDTRNDVLRRDLDDVATRAGTHGCVVLTGSFDDPYTGTTIAFERGQDTSTQVQIDHVVALSDSWQKGAQRLSADERRLLANDPLNLLASDGPANMSKGDGDAATWLPPNKKFRCSYVARQVAVKQSYDLWVTGAEHDAMQRVLTTCPKKKLPKGDATEPAAPLIPATAVQEPEQQRTTAPQPDAGSGSGGGSVYYENCDAARAAGAAPVHRGDPGYDGHLDGDGDGVGCE